MTKPSVTAPGPKLFDDQCSHNSFRKTIPTQSTSTSETCIARSVLFIRDWLYRTLTHSIDNAYRTVRIRTPSELSLPLKKETTLEASPGANDRIGGSSPPARHHLRKPLQWVGSVRARGGLSARHEPAPDDETSRGAVCTDEPASVATADRPATNPSSHISRHAV